ncbi:DUF1852 domain-containing protein [Rhodanobacter aciditrophus]|uniref:DUF1852 domain-containing protein n=1 Tax=Rhodanobacter aciditrophus TaxID=1623218 RepID=A0ABW4AXK6_9GAMM
MNTEFKFDISRLRFDKDYQPASNTRLTTNFANLARGKQRESNLRNTLKMINNRFNSLASWDNPTGNRYEVVLEIISVNLAVAGQDTSFPSMEVLKTNIIDLQTGKRLDGIVGNNFSSYVRDYDFSVLLLEHNQGQSQFSVPANFGELHGKLFKSFIQSPTYQEQFKKPPVICLSVSDNKTYDRSENHHPVLGYEYQPNDTSLTEEYFKKMGLSVRYFMPPNSVSPLAFYFVGDLLNDYSNLELISTIATMETFQKIYRPEIYNANAVAGKRYQPNLNNSDHSLTQIVYDREERSALAKEQGKFTQEHFIKPYQTLLEQWSAQVAL